MAFSMCVCVSLGECKSLWKFKCVCFGCVLVFCALGCVCVFGCVQVSVEVQMCVLWVCASVLCALGVCVCVCK